MISWVSASWPLTDLAGKGFITNSELRKHERRHAGLVERRHVCQYCGKTYVTPQHLKVHLRRHTGMMSWTHQSVASTHRYSCRRTYFYLQATDRSSATSVSSQRHLSPCWSITWPLTRERRITSVTCANSNAPAAVSWLNYFAIHGDPWALTWFPR